MQTHNHILSTNEAAACKHTATGIRRRELRFPQQQYCPANMVLGIQGRVLQKKAQNQTKPVRKQNTYPSEHSNWPPPWCAQQISAYLSLLQHFSTSSLFGTSHLNPHYHGLLAAMQSPDHLSIVSI